MLDERLQVGPRRSVLHTQRITDGRREQRGIAQRRQRDERDWIVEALRHLQRQAGLADASRPDEGDQPIAAIAHQRQELIEARAVVHERIERERRARPGRDGSRCIGGIGVRAGLPFERDPFVTSESEAIGQRDRGVESRSSVDPTFEVADRTGADERPRRELLLAQPGLPAMTPKDRSERRIPGHGRECKSGPVRTAQRCGATPVETGGCFMVDWSITGHTGRRGRSCRVPAAGLTSAAAGVPCSASPCSWRCWVEVVLGSCGGSQAHVVRLRPPPRSGQSAGVARLAAG